MMGRRWILWALWVLALPACSQDTAPAAIPEGGEWILQVRSAHQRADAALVGADRELARQALSGALELPVPGPVSREHQRVVHQDLLFRLARLELDDGAHARAWHRAEQGLALGASDDLFTANLLIARGRAEEGMGKATEAARSYYRALEINQRLLSALLGKDAGRP